MKWISVKDKLPEIEKGGIKMVLIYQKYHDDDDFLSFNCVDLVIIQYIKTAAGENVLVWMNDQYEIEPMPETITHWMPLPEPPNQV